MQGQHMNYEFFKSQIALYVDICAGSNISTLRLQICRLYLSFQVF